MPKKNGAVARKAWNLLRLALMWARKGGVFKHRILMELRSVPKYLRSSFGKTTSRVRLHYLECELSLRFHLPHIPCMQPQVEFDYDFDKDDEADGYNEGGRMSFLQNGDEEEDYCYGCCDDIVPYEDEGIDVKAEQFIAKFYEQMKLQRQNSYRQHKGNN